MVSLHVSKYVSDFENSFKQSIRSLKECHNILEEYATDDDDITALLEDLKSIGQSYKEEFVDFHKYHSAIHSTEEDFNEDGNINDNFDSVFKRRLKATKSDPAKADAFVDAILGFTRTNADENGNNESLLCTQSSVNPIDPITKMQIRTPFKNKICSHIYDKDSILAYIKNKKKLAKCPYVGCANSNMRVESLELDFSLSQRINRGEFTSTQLQHSVTSIAESSDEEEEVLDDGNASEEEEMDVSD